MNTCKTFLRFQSISIYDDLDDYVPDHGRGGRHRGDRDRHGYRDRNRDRDTDRHRDRDRIRSEIRRSFAPNQNPLWISLRSFVPPSTRSKVKVAKDLSDPHRTMTGTTTTATAATTAIEIETGTAIITADPAGPTAAAAAAIRGGEVTGDPTSIGDPKKRTAWGAAAEDTSTPGDSPVRIGTSKLFQI